MFWQRWLYKEALELLDREGLSERGLAIHRDLATLNRRMGWTRRHLQFVEEWWVALGSPSPFRVLDVGAGIGDLLEAMCAWAEDRGVELEATGIDLQPAYVSYARQRLEGRARILQGDARELTGEWDLATCTLTLHHIPREQRSQVISSLGMARKATYMFDLERTLHAWLFSPLLLRVLGMGRDTVADGQLSIRRACTAEEFATLVAPLPGRMGRVFPSTMATWPEI